MEQPKGAAGPLAGIRVVDFSAVVSGPLCSQILGDLGADVVKVETPRGDATRMMGPPFHGGLTAMFAQFNRNKRSIAVDLKQPEGRSLARRLADGADVVLENYRPGVAERLGFGFAELAERNPRLVYVSITGFGPDGPYADLPAYDTVIQGLSGFLPLQGEPGAPRLVKSIVADKTSALTAAYATLAALFARERSGRGQRIDVPMLDAYAAFMLPDLLGFASFPSLGPPPAGPLLDVHRVWQTADGHVVMMIIEDSQFRGLCSALQREELLDDPRCTSLLARIQNAEVLFAMLGEELRKWPTDEIVKRARERGAPVSRVNDLTDFLADPHVQANATVFEAEDAQAERLRMLRPAPRFGETRSQLRRNPPRLGEHSDEILREIGCSPGEIDRLRAAGVVR